MRMRLLVPFACFALAALAGCGGEPTAAPVIDPVPAAASEASTPDPEAPLSINGTDILTVEEVLYGATCDEWRSGSWTVSELSSLAAESKHVGLAKAVDLLVSSPTAGRMAMDRMCADVN